MTISEIIKSISKQERLFIIIAIVLVIFVTTLPYIYGWLTTPDDMTYLANYHRASGDHYVYLSMIEEVREGAITHHNLFTSEPHDPVQVRPFWFMMGMFAKTFNLDGILMIQIARIILIFAAIPVIYLSLATFLKQRSTRLIAFILALGGAGFGYFFYQIIPEIIPNIYTMNFYDAPVDLWLTEGVPLLLFSASPHFQLSLICLLLSFVFFVLGFKNGNFKYLVASGGFNLFLAFFHTYETVFIYFIITAYAVGIIIWAWKKFNFKEAKKYIFRWLVVCLVALPGIAYQFLIFFSIPILKSWAEQSRTISPDIQYYLLGYGLVLVAAVIGTIIVIKNSRHVGTAPSTVSDDGTKPCFVPTNHAFFLLVWFLGTWPLLYIPIAFNRRFIEGIFVPMGILAAIGIVWFFKKFKNKSEPIRRLVIIIIIVLGAVAIIPTNAYNIWSFIEVQKAYKTTPFYLPTVERESLEWLQKNASIDDVILSEHISGFVIPAFTGKRVYIGHDLQTANFPAKKQGLENFFKDNTSKHAWLKENNITYLYYGPNELGKAFKPDQHDYLKLDFENDKVKIYKVR